MGQPELLNYILEFAMLFPAAILAFAPLRDRLRFRSAIVYTVALICVAALTLLGASIACSFAVPKEVVMAPISLALLALLFSVSALSPWKTLYCYLNAAMLWAFSTMYANYMTAPWEIGNESLALTIPSALVCLATALIVCILYARTLLVKIPSLFDQGSLDGLWKWLALLPLALTALLIWLTPASASNVMVGAVRPKAMVMLLLVPLTAWLLYHIAWLTASRISESERLRRENEVLRLEERRHDALMRRIDEIRAFRHDLRHHMAAVAELGRLGKTDEAIDYAEQFLEATKEPPARVFSENTAVDAVAAYFQGLADAKSVRMTWLLDLPKELPISQVDFCSVLSNLTENAIIAAAQCDEPLRTASAKASIFSDSVITLVVENRFSGPPPKTGDAEFPSSSRSDHGIGLPSVAAIARKYNGSLNVSAENSVFTATVLMYIRN